jgi:hypothetical protein
MGHLNVTGIGLISARTLLVCTTWVYCCVSSKLLSAGLLSWWLPGFGGWFGLCPPTTWSPLKSLPLFNLQVGCCAALHPMGGAWTWIILSKSIPVVFWWLLFLDLCGERFLRSFLQMFWPPALFILLLAFSFLEPSRNWQLLAAEYKV